MSGYDLVHFTDLDFDPDGFQPELQVLLDEPLDAHVRVPEHVEEARKYCLMLESPDLALHPYKRNRYSQASWSLLVDKYYDSSVQLARPWIKNIPKDIYANITNTPYYPYTENIYNQNFREETPCNCIHYLPLIDTGASQHYVVDFACGCCHKCGSFHAIPAEHNASEEQLRCLGRTSHKSFTRKGGLFCPITNKFFLCPARYLNIRLPSKRKKRTVGGQLSLSDVKGAAKKKRDYRTAKRRKAGGDEDVDTETDPEPEATSDLEYDNDD